MAQIIMVLVVLVLIVAITTADTESKMLASAAKANPNLTRKPVLREKLLPIQTFKSSSGRLLAPECRISCYPAYDTCPLGCECEMDYSARTERYFCEPYDSGICSPCYFDNGNMCPSGCGCYQIEGTSEYGCLPN